MSMASVHSTFYKPQQLTHINTSDPLIKIWGIVEKSKFDYIRRIIDRNNPSLAAGRGQIRNFTELIPGKSILALHNNLFQRAEFLQLNRGHTIKVIVNLIDLGIVTSVDVSDIRIDDSIFEKVPGTRLAEDFILHGVRAKKQWSNQEVESVNRYLNNCTEFNLTGIVSDKKILQVIMNMNAEKINLSDFLIKEGLADHISEDNLNNLLRARYNKMSAPVVNPFFTVSPSCTSNMQVSSSFAIPEQSQVRGPNVAPVYSPETSQIPLPSTPQRIIEPKPAQSLHSVATVLSYVYPTLPVGSTHDVVVSCVIDGMNAFTVQLKKSIDVDLPALNSKIDDIRPVPIIEQIGPGTLCLGRSSEDDCLYRAVVSNISVDGASLYFVDYGTTEIVPFDEIYRISPEFLQEPPMALRFALADLTNAFYPAEAHNIFSKMVLQENSEFKLEVVEPLVPTQQRCELFVVTNGKTSSVKDKVLDKVNLMKRVEYKELTLKKNQVADVTVIHIDDLSRFFVQLDLNQAILEMIMKCAEDHCINSENADILSTGDIVENMAVCAPFDGDKYYRCSIVDEPDNEGNVTVFFVDYGNQDTVHYSKLRIMNNDMMSQFPKQAIECRLDIDSSLDTNEELINLLIDLAEGKNFKMSVKDILPDNVLLVDLVDQHGLNVVVHLKEAFGGESLPAGYSAPPKSSLQKSSGSRRKKNRASVEDNLLSSRESRDKRSRRDDRKRSRNFDSRHKDSDSDYSSRRDRTSRADSENPRRRDRRSSDRSNDRYGGYRDRYGDRRHNSSKRSSRRSQDDNRAGLGKRRRSRDSRNKTLDDGIGGRSSDDNRFDDGSRRKRKRPNDGEIKERSPRIGNRFYDVGRKSCSRYS